VSKPRSQLAVAHWAGFTPTLKIRSQRKFFQPGYAMYTPGYSMDMRRAFARYFFHGAKFYSRGKFLDGAKAFVVGDLTAPGEDPEGRDEVVTERLGKLGVPIAFGAPFGHAGRNQPVAFGCTHALDADAGKLTPLESPTVAAQS